MSEQKLTYMEQLDAWTYQTVIQPMLEFVEHHGELPASEWNRTRDAIYKAIRAKVWESYKNGQAAGPKAIRPARKEPRYAQAKTR